MDQLRQAFRRVGVTRETLAKAITQEHINFLANQSSLPKDVILTYLKDRFRRLGEYSDQTPLYRIAQVFSQSHKLQEPFVEFLDRATGELKMSRGIVLLTRNEWGLRRPE